MSAFHSTIGVIARYTWDRWRVDASVSNVLECVELSQQGLSESSWRLELMVSPPVFKRMYFY